MKAMTEDGEKEVIPYDFSEWKENDDDGYTQMCVWPSTIVEPGEEDQVQDFFEKAFGLKNPVHVVGCVITQPDKVDGEYVSDTGGRCDFLFFVHTDDIGRFAVPRLQYGIRWWEDVVGNKNHKIYPSSFLSEAKEVYSW